MSKRDIWEWFKDKFTDVLGLLIMIFVSFGVWIAPLFDLNSINLIFDGIVGLLLGFILLMFPDGVIISFIKRWASKKFGGGKEEKPTESE